MHDNLIRETENFVRSRLKDESTGHDYWHAVRVRNLAKRIAATEENADFLIIELAALLHDIGDRKVIRKSENDPSIARNFLQNQNILQTKIIDQIMFIIENLSFSKNLGQKKNADLPIEFQIVQDADRLDGLGAIGIARSFATGQMLNRPIYDPDFCARENLNQEEYMKDEGSTLAHFDEKLFKLKDLMNTTTAKKIAVSRDEFMRDFYDKFLKEWSGND